MPEKAGSKTLLDFRDNTFHYKIKTSLRNRFFKKRGLQSLNIHTGNFFLVILLLMNPWLCGVCGPPFPSFLELSNVTGNPRKLFAAVATSYCTLSGLPSSHNKMPFSHCLITQEYRTHLLREHAARTRLGAQRVYCSLS